jgi:hypothetical protein
LSIFALLFWTVSLSLPELLCTILTHKKGAVSGMGLPIGALLINTIETEDAWQEF